MNHVMIDLETLGTNKKAAIIEIGAVRFNAYGPEISTDEFHTYVSIDSNLQANRKIDASTLSWTLNEPHGVTLLQAAHTQGVELSEALTGLSNFITKDDYVWACGAAFDLAILETAYAEYNWEVPWKFWNEKCYRTMKNLSGVPPYKQIGVKHSARDDAYSQAIHLQQIFAHLKMRVTQ